MYVCTCAVSHGHSCTFMSANDNKYVHFTIPFLLCTPLSNHLARLHEGLAPYYTGPIVVQNQKGIDEVNYHMLTRATLRMKANGRTCTSYGVH